MSLDDPFSTLTKRELEIFELLKRGCSNAEIASVLGAAPATVKNHLAAVYRKLRVSNRTEAVGLEREPPTGIAPPPPSSTPPAIAVLRFVCSEPDGRLARYADGIAEDITTRLSRCWYPVVARCSTFTIGAQHAGDAVSIGHALGARYLVEGTLEGFDARVRLHVRLVDASTGHVLWAERSDAPTAGLFALLDDLAQHVLDGLYTSALSHIESEQQHRNDGELAPWQLGVRGMWHFWRADAQANERARALFHAALASDPRHRLALYGAALTHQRDLAEQWTRDSSQTVAALSEVSDRFRSLWPDDPWALLMSSYACLYRGERERALALTQRALTREPSLLGGRSLYGQLLAMDGQMESAVAEIERALRLSPCSPERWVYECAMALAYFAGRSYAESAAWARRATISSNRAAAMPYGVLASASALLDDTETAREAAHVFRKLQPQFSSARFRPMVASTRPEIAARYLDGLTLASRL